MTSKADKIKQYNELNSGYNITGIKKITQEQIDGCAKYGKDDLYELYAKPSDAKIEAWEWIRRTYKPSRIISVQGSCMTFSVLLEADNGDMLHITRDNNYLVEVV